MVTHDAQFGVQSGLDAREGFLFVVETFAELGRRVSLWWGKDGDGLTFCGLCSLSFCGDEGALVGDVVPVMGFGFSGNPLLSVGMLDWSMVRFLGLYVVMTTSSESRFTARSVNVFLGIEGEFSFLFGEPNRSGDPSRSGEVLTPTLVGEKVRGEEPVCCTGCGTRVGVRGCVGAQEGPTPWSWTDFRSERELRRFLRGWTVGGASPIVLRFERFL